MRDLSHSLPPSRAVPWPGHLARGVFCENDGFTLGDDTPLIRWTDVGGFAVEEDGERCLALLSVLARQPVGADALVPFKAAAIHWARGDKALANLRLIFSSLPKLDTPADVARLQAAAYCLDHGMAPRELMTALDLDPSVLDALKFDPDEPRVPAGNGRESGRWTDDARSEDFISSSTPPRIRIAANGPFKPEGIETVPSGSIDPLDPANLNKVPPTAEEQQAIANALTIIFNGTPDDVKKLQPHNYQNLPEKTTGAILPPDPEGYASYNLTPNKNRGQARIIVNKSRDRAYYTSNHYFSFYGVDIDR